MIIVFLCVYLISKFFNFDEIKKYILALIAFFTLTNSTYPIKHGGANENKPEDSKELELIQRSYNDQSVPYIYPYIFEKNIIVDGFNIFIHMKDTHASSFIITYKSQNGRNPTYAQINEHCFEQMLSELNRCFDGTIHLVIKSGQSDILKNFVDNRVILNKFTNVIVHDAFYNIHDPIQMLSIQRIKDLSKLKDIETEEKKAEKKELHRLKSLDDYLLIYIATQTNNFTIISNDKYKQIRQNTEIPGIFTIRTYKDGKFNYSVINPTLETFTIPIRAMVTNFNFSFQFVSPIFNVYGEIVMFAKYTNNRFIFSDGQEYMIYGYRKYTEYLHFYYEKLLDYIVKNIQDKSTLIEKFNEEYFIKLRNLGETEINFNSLMRPRYKALPPSIISCRTHIIGLKEKLDSLLKTGNIDEEAYHFLPSNAGEVYVRHLNLINPSRTIPTTPRMIALMPTLEQVREQTQLQKNIAMEEYKLLEDENMIRESKAMIEKNIRKGATKESFATELQELNRRQDVINLQRLHLPQVEMEKIKRTPLPSPIQPVAPRTPIILSDEEKESQVQSNGVDFPFNRMSIESQPSIQSTPSAPIKPQRPPAKTQQFYKHPKPK